MTPQEIDVIVRVAGATLLLAATVLLSGRDDRRNGLFFLPLALCLCGFLAGNTPDAALRLSGLAGYTAYLLSGFGAVHDGSHRRHYRLVHRGRSPQTRAVDTAKPDACIDASGRGSQH